MKNKTDNSPKYLSLFCVFFYDFDVLHARKTLEPAPLTEKLKIRRLQLEASSDFNLSVNFLIFTSKFLLALKKKGGGQLLDNSPFYT